MAVGPGISAFNFLLSAFPRESEGALSANPDAGWNRGRVSEELRARAKRFAAWVIRLYVQLPRGREEAKSQGAIATPKRAESDGQRAFAPHRGPR